MVDNPTAGVTVSTWPSMNMMFMHQLCRKAKPPPPPGVVVATSAHHGGESVSTPKDNG